MNNVGHQEWLTRAGTLAWDSESWGYRSWAHDCFPCPSGAQRSWKERSVKGEDTAPCSVALTLVEHLRCSPVSLPQPVWHSENNVCETPTLHFWKIYFLLLEAKNATTHEPNFESRVFPSLSTSFWNFINKILYTRGSRGKFQSACSKLKRCCTRLGVSREGRASQVSLVARALGFAATSCWQPWASTWGATGKLPVGGSSVCPRMP